jgi:hypothetical protein
MERIAAFVSGCLKVNLDSVQAIYSNVIPAKVWVFIRAH